MMSATKLVQRLSPKLRDFPSPGNCLMAHSSPGLGLGKEYGAANKSSEEKMTNEGECLLGTMSALPMKLEH